MQEITSREAVKQFDELMLLLIHDAKDPLRRSLTRAQMLERQCGAIIHSDCAKHLAEVITANKSLELLLSRMAEYAQISRDDHLRSNSLPAPLILRGALQRLAPLIEKSKAVIRFADLPSHPLPAGVQKVFFELVDNGLKFIPQRVPEIVLECDASPSMIRFDVQDNGIGIDMAFAEHILQPLRRLHGRETYPGSGMGLSICQRIVQMHGGDIWLESSGESGSLFRFELPLAMAA